MNSTFFDHCQIDYKTVARLIKSVSVKILGASITEDRLNEMISEGWIVALEAMKTYDPSRGAQASSYIWGSLWHKLRRHCGLMYQNLNMHAHDDCICEQVSTDTIPQSGIFDSNPWGMQPDVMYEKKERLTFWEQIKSMNESGIQCCLACHPKSPTAAERAMAYRRKKRYLDKMQASYQMMTSNPKM